MRVAIIPARGGSKRIARKNIKLFHGKPMIAYTIEAALNSGCFDRVIVSSDDDEIIRCAQEYGAQAPFVRPAALSDDFATTMDVMAHAVNFLQTQGEALSAVCCIYATAPFLQASDLRQGLQLLEQGDCQFVFSATTYAFPIQRAIRLNASHEVSMFDEQYALTRSQDLDEAYHDAGQFYWGKPHAFEQKLPIFASHSRIVPLPRKRCQDIDTPEDWELAEVLYGVLKSESCA